jgi:hypothetical protein
MLTSHEDPRMAHGTSPYRVWLPVEADWIEKLVEIRRESKPDEEMGEAIAGALRWVAEEVEDQGPNADLLLCMGRVWRELAWR